MTGKGSLYLLVSIVVLNALLITAQGQVSHGPILNGPPGKRRSSQISSAEVGSILLVAMMLTHTFSSSSNVLAFGMYSCIRSVKY